MHFVGAVFTTERDRRVRVCQSASSIFRRVWEASLKAVSVIPVMEAARPKKHTILLIRNYFANSCSANSNPTVLQKLPSASLTNSR